MTKLTSLIFVAGFGGVAHANGFLLNEFDAKAVGRGNAASATDVDPSSIYYNVGGLAAGPDGTQVMIGASLIQPNASFTPDGGGAKTDSSTPAQYVPGLFLSSKVTDMIGVGLGFYTPFGLAVEWPSTSAQAEFAKHIALHTFFITPAVGLNLGSFIPGLSVGAGLDIVPATIELEQNIVFGSDPVGNAHLGGSAVGFGWRAGVMYKPSSAPNLAFGAMWRSNVTENFDGTANFKAAPEYQSMLPANGDIKTTLNLPMSITGGVGYRPLDGLELEADVIYTKWSKFKDLNIGVACMGSTCTNINQTQDYSDTVTFRLGGEYAMPTLGAAFRAGFIYDPTPVSSSYLNPQLPDINRMDVTLGASKSFGNYGAHLGLLWVLPGSNSTSNAMYTPEMKGKYDVNAFVASVSITGYFAKPKD